MHLSYGSEQLPRRRHDLVFGEIAGAEHIVHAAQDFYRLFNSIADKGVGHLDIKTDLFKIEIDSTQFFLQALNGWLVMFSVDKCLINPRLSCLFVFKQFVGNPSVGGDNVDSIVDVIFITQDDIIKNFIKAGHGGTTNLFDPQRTWCCHDYFLIFR